MGKSPLETSIGSAHVRRFSKPVMLLSLFGVLALGGGVLAANITISGTGGATTVEFGQGTISAIACDSDITLVPSSTFDGTNFLVSAVEIRNIDQRQGTSSGNNGCNGKTLTVKVLNSSNTSIASIATVVPSATAASATITVTPTPTASALATAVAKLTIESN